VKSLGFLLITAGFLAGAYFSVEQRSGVSAAPFLAALAVGVMGVVLVRVATHRERTHADTISANLGAIGSSLESVVEKVRDLDQNKDELDVYDLRHHIDEKFPDDLDAFVQARQSIIHSFGLQAYADVMNPFAAGERYLNRVWSASADGYIDEAHVYLAKAREQFEQTLEVYRGLRRV
jgi:hypothetical protein